MLDCAGQGRQPGQQRFRLGNARNEGCLRLVVGVQQAARHDWNAMNLDAADIAEQSRRILLSCLDCSQERLQSGSTGPNTRLQAASNC